jgi:hypothetical protein
MAVTGNTELVLAKAQLISELVQRELKFQSKLMPTVTDFSALAAPGSRSVALPKFGSFTVENRASAAAATIQDLGVVANDTINFDKRATVSWLIDSMDALQSTPAVQQLYIQRAASSHARYIDEQIIAVLDAAAGLDVGAAPITQPLILDMREELLKNFAKMDQLFLLIGPDQEKVMLAINDFVRADAYGSSNIPSGQIGRIYGVNVLVHQGVAAGKAFMYDKDAVGIAMQRAPAYGENPANQYGVGSVQAVLDQLFGLSALQLGQLGKGATLSPLIVEM